MKKRISHISIRQTSKVLTLLYVVLGLLFIPIGVLMILVGQTPMGIVYVLMPFIYGIIGYPLFAAMCWVYNTLAKSVGGIEFTVDGYFDVRCPACGELGVLHESSIVEKIECPKCKKVFPATSSHV